MTAFVTLLDAVLAAEQPITTGKMTALRDNPIAIAQGDPTAPSINPAAIEIGGKGTDGTMVNGTTLSGPGYFDFDGITVSTPKTIPLCSIIRVKGNVTLSSVLTVALRSLTSTTNDDEARNLAAVMDAVIPADGTGTTTGTGGSNAGQGGPSSTGPLPIGRSSFYRPWGMLRPIMGGNGGVRSGGSGGNDWGPGGGCLILIVEGDCDFTGGSIKANGGITNDLGAGSNQPGGGAGGSIIVVCTGQITNGTFEAKGGTARSDGSSGGNGDGGGGAIYLIATDFTGTQTMTVTGATYGNAGVSAAITLTRDQIRTLLGRM